MLLYDEIQVYYGSVLLTRFVCLSVDRIDNSRMESLEFETKTSFTLHGFAGYFEAVLFKDILISMSSSLNLTYKYFKCQIERFATSLPLKAVLYLLRFSVCSVQHLPPQNACMQRGLANQREIAVYLAKQELLNARGFPALPTGASSGIFFLWIYKQYTDWPFFCCYILSASELSSSTGFYANTLSCLPFF